MNLSLPVVASPGLILSHAAIRSRRVYILLHISVQPSCQACDFCCVRLVRYEPYFLVKQAIHTGNMYSHRACLIFFILSARPHFLYSVHCCEVEGSEPLPSSGLGLSTDCVRQTVPAHLDRLEDQFKSLLQLRDRHSQESRDLVQELLEFESDTGCCVRERETERDRERDRERGLRDTQTKGGCVDFLTCVRECGSSILVFTEREDYCCQ